MYKKIFPLLCIAILSSCNSDDDTTDNSELFHLSKDATITDLVDGVSGNLLIDFGKNIVFKYELIEGSLEDERAFIPRIESIYFEIETTATEFSFSNNELSSINAYYNCYLCERFSSVPIDNGNISGFKIEDNLWSITVNVNISFANELDEPVNVNFTEEFDNQRY